MVDIKFIAKKAGVSIATVSRVLNKSKPVSIELEQRVLDAVIKYKYYPNRNAKLLANKKSFLICILLEENINHYQAMLMPLLCKYIEDKGYQGVIHIVGPRFKHKMEIMQELEAKQMDGVVCFFNMSPSDAKKIKSQVQIPFVYSSPLSQDVDFYEFNRQSAYLGTKYLIDLGHKNIGGLFSDEEYEENHLYHRYLGFRDAVEEAHLPIREEIYIKGDITMINSGKMIDRLLGCTDLPTALFCISDELAVGSMFRLFQQGIRVPEDISVMGYDGIPLGQSIVPRLTTVAQPYKVWLKYIVNRLISEIEKVGENNLLLKELDDLEPWIDVGESCREN